MPQLDTASSAEADDHDGAGQDEDDGAPAEGACQDWEGTATLAGEVAVEVTVGPEDAIHELAFEGDGWICALGCDDPRLSATVYYGEKGEDPPTPAEGRILELWANDAGRGKAFSASCAIEISGGGDPLVVTVSYDS